MSRPFALLGITVFGSLLLAAWWGPAAAELLAWICTGLGLCALLGAAVAAGFHRGAGWDGRHPQRKAFAARMPFFAVLFAAGALALFLFSSSWQSRVAPYGRLDGAEAAVRGQVLDYPEHKLGKYYYRLRVERVMLDGGEDKLKPFQTLLSTNQPFSCGPYDWLECTVTFYRFQTGGLYSTENSRLADGPVLGSYLSGYDDVSVIPETQSPPGKLFAELRHRVGRNFSRLLPREEAALIRAMLLGERDDLSDGAYADFKQIGSTHLLVISGLHLAAVAAFLSLLFGRLPLGRVGRNLLTAAVLACFLAVTAFPVSAVRGGVMYLVALLADCFGRKADSVNSLGFAVLVLCLQNPFSGGDLGLALSVFATLGILLLYEKLFRGLLHPLNDRPRLRRMARPLAASLAVTLSAMAFTLPLQVLVFGGLPLLAPVANLILVLPCTLLLYCAFAAAFLTLLPVLVPLAMPFAFCAGWLSRFALWAARGLGSLPGAYFDLGRDTWLIVLGAALLLVFLAGWSGWKRAVSLTAALGFTVLLAAGGLFETWRWRDVVTVAVADQGEASCVLLLKNGEASVLSLDGFYTGAALSLLSQNNVHTLRTLFLPSGSQNARLAAQKLLRSYPARRLLLPSGAYVGKDLSREKTGLWPEVLTPGSGFEALPGVEAVLSPDGSLLSFQANGVSVAVELGEAGPGECGLLITGREDSRINSPFTVLQTDAIIGENQTRDFRGSAGPGWYLLPAGQDGVCLDLTPGGALHIREGS